MPRTSTAAAVVAPLSERDTTLMSYHSNHRNRITRGERRELYGMELEVTAGSGGQRTQAVAEANVGEPEELRVDAETDGSLSSATGVEFITRRPMTVGEFLNDNGWLTRFIGRITEAGVRAGAQPQGYGIHMNVNCFGWSNYAKAAFCAAINLGRTYCQPVAGRPGSYGASGLYINTPTSTRAFVRGWEGRSGAAYVRAPTNPDCIEVRIFQSSTDPETIRSYIRHLQEVRRFSKRYQTLLLYTALSTRLGRFTQAEAESFTNFLWTDRPTYAEAIARLPDSSGPARLIRSNDYNWNSTHTEVFNAVFDTSTSFRLRKEALRRVWISDESAAGESSYGPDASDPDDDDYDDDY